MWACFCGACGLKLKPKGSAPPSGSERAPIPVLPRLAQAAAKYGAPPRPKRPRPAAAPKPGSLDQHKGVPHPQEPVGGPPHVGRAGALLMQQRQALETAKEQRERQERIISTLEESNTTAREASKYRPSSGLANGAIWSALRVDERTLSQMDLPPYLSPALLSKPPYAQAQGGPTPTTYAEWHLKTVYNIHDLQDTLGRQENRKQRTLPSSSSSSSSSNVFADTWAPGSESFQSSESYPLLESIISSPAETPLFSLNPIRVAPGTPLTGPQSLPVHITTPGAEEKLKNWSDRVLSRSPTRDLIFRRWGNTPGSARVSTSVGGGRAPLTPLHQKISLGPTFDTHPATSSSPLAHLSSIDTSSEITTSWFWGRRASASGSAQGTQDVDENKSNQDESQDSGLVAEPIEFDEEDRDFKPSCGIFWRGDDRAAVILENKLKDRLRNSAEELANGSDSDGEMVTEVEVGIPPKIIFPVEGSPSYEKHAAEPEKSAAESFLTKLSPSDQVFGKLREIAVKFMYSSDLEPIMNNLKDLKDSIVECYRREVEMGKQLDLEKSELDRRRSAASVSVAEKQVKLSNEHAKLMHIDTRLVQLRKVEDEFTAREEESIEEEAKLLRRQVVLGRRINKCEARLATALAVEARVHNECDAELREARTVHMAQRQDTVRAMRGHEDGIYELHLTVRGAAATRIQLFVRRTWEERYKKMWLAAIAEYKRDTLDAMYDAAVLVQRVYRIRLARRKVIELTKASFEKVFDEGSETFYYFNIKTGESRWSKPALLGESDDITTVRSDPSVQVHIPETPTEAALLIQRAYRARLARKKVSEMAKGSFEKLFDEETKAYFYYNIKTGDSQWRKPSVLGEKDDIATARSDSTRTPRTPRVVRIPESPEEAASLIQRVYRSRLARRRVIELTKHTYEKLFDEDSGVYYYFNNMTGESQWTKPSVLGNNDDLPTSSVISAYD